MELTPPNKFLVQNKTQGNLGEYLLTWEKSFLAESYNIYRNYVPYGLGDLIAEIPANKFFYTDKEVQLIDGTLVYYRIEAIRNNTAMSTRYQTAQNTTEYINYKEGTWSDTNEGVYDPHDNKYFGYKNDQSYKPGSVNPLPSNILRRYQLNKINSRDSLWLLQDVGELVYLIKQKRYNYSLSEEDQDRAVGRSEIVEYFPPIIISAAIASPGQTHIISQRGAAIEKQTSSWTIYTPHLVDGDIIVTRQNERFEIQNVVYQRSWRGTPGWQQFTIRNIDITDPLFSHAQLEKLDGTQLYHKINFWQKYERN